MDAELPGTERLPPLRRDLIGARVSVRRSFLVLLVLSLLPLVLLGVGRSLVQVERSKAVVEARLSERAAETAASQSEVVRTAGAVLSLLAEQADVRSGGILCDLALGKADAGFAAFSNISRFRADGRIACSSARPLPDVGFSDQAWWKTAQGADTLLLTGPEWGPISKRQVLRAVLPMKTEDGRFDGVITAAIDMGWMQRKLESHDFGEDAVALVLDGRGRILLGNQPAQFAAVDVGIGPGKLGALADASGRNWTYAVAPMVQSYDGRKALYIAYAMPESKLFSWAWWQAGWSIAQPLIAVLLVALVIWFGTNGLVLRWLRELRVLAEAFARGDYRARPANFEAAPVEFRALAAALYKMGQAVDRRDTELRAALDRQNHLVREIHHRVKNNLQIVMSLLSLQSDRLETAAGRAAMDQIRLRISTLALVHRLLYETDEQATISSQTLLGGACELLNQTLGKRSDIAVHCDFAAAELDIDTAIPLCLWLVEAASNAWLHAFPDNRAGEMNITLRFVDGHGVLEVADNGVGFAAVDGQQPGARGLRILTGIAKQVGGTSEIASTPGGGTRLRLRYPVPTAAPRPAAA